MGTVMLKAPLASGVCVALNGDAAVIRDADPDIQDAGLADVHAAVLVQILNTVPLNLPFCD
jgi:hypothetical protein